MPSMPCLAQSDELVPATRCRTPRTAAGLSKYCPKGRRYIEDEEADSAILVIGPDDGSLPIPLAKDQAGWYFDTKAGIEEILDRRIGRNELYTIASMRAFVDAEREYAAADPLGDAEACLCRPCPEHQGQEGRTLLAHEKGQTREPAGSPGGGGREPLAIADDVERGPRPFHGYFYKVLTAQGDRAPGGAKSYLKDGRLTEGFALVAWPASYGSSGIMTFQVNQKGMVYQRDLGEDTDKVAAAIDAYNPGDGWEAAVD